LPKKLSGIFVWDHSSVLIFAKILPFLRTQIVILEKFLGGLHYLAHFAKFECGWQKTEHLETIHNNKFSTHRNANILEPEFSNVLGALESIPRNHFRQQAG
jgi:hypothetical protein